MSLLGLIEKRSTLASPSAFLQGFFGGSSTESGVVVSEANALTYSTVYACVQVIAEAIATLPLRLYKTRSDGGIDEVSDLKISELTASEPNGEMSAGSFKSTLMGWVLTWGNGYAEIERSKAGLPIALHPLAPNRVIPRRAEKLDPATGGKQWRIEYYLSSAVASPYQLDQIPVNGLTPIDRDDMLHIAGLGFNGIMGYAPPAMAREAIGLGLSAQAYGARFFGNSGVPSGVLEAKGTIKNPQKLRDHWDAVNSGRGQRRTAVLEDGVTFKSIGIPPEDSQFLETRKFQRSEIAGIYRVPPHMIGDLERSTNNNIEHQGIDFVRYCLMGWLVRFEEECCRKLLTPAQKMAGYFFRFDADELFRGDTSSRYAAYAIGRQWGWLNADDVRAREGLNPLPEDQGKMYLVPMNMIPADQAAMDKVPPGEKTVDPNNPATGIETPLNGAQITAAIDVVGKLRSGTIEKVAAVELLVGMGIDRTRAGTIATATAERAGQPGPEDKAFLQALTLAFANNPTTKDIVANSTTIAGKAGVVAGAGAPFDPKYQEPWVEVQQPAGQAVVTGETVKDAQGDIVGGVAEGEEGAGADEKVNDYKLRSAAARHMRPLLLDIAGRCVRREVAGLRRLAPESRQTQTAAGGEFYRSHGDYVRAALMPAAACLASLQGVPFDKARDAVEALAAPADALFHRHNLLAAFDATLAEWEEKRAEVIVDHLLGRIR